MYNLFVALLLLCFPIMSLSAQTEKASDFFFMDSTGKYSVYLMPCGNEIEDVILIVNREIGTKELSKIALNHGGKYPLTSALRFPVNYPLNSIELEGLQIWLRQANDEAEPRIVQLSTVSDKQVEELLYDLSYITGIF